MSDHGDEWAVADRQRIINCRVSQYFFISSYTSFSLALCLPDTTRCARLCYILPLVNNTLRQDSNIIQRYQLVPISHSRNLQYISLLDLHVANSNPRS